MRNLDLQDFAEFIYRETFFEELKIPVVVNNKLKQTIAWFRDYYDKDINPVRGQEKIEVSNKLLDQNLYVIADILLHEFTHYYLWKNKQPFDDTDDEFKQLCQKVGASLTNTFVDDDFKCDYITYTARHSCGYVHKIYYRNTDDKLNIPICFCPECNKELKYKKTPNKKMKYVAKPEVKRKVAEYNKYCKA